MINVSEHVVHTLQGDQSNLKKDLFFLLEKISITVNIKIFPRQFKKFEMGLIGYCTFL